MTTNITNNPTKILEGAVIATVFKDMPESVKHEYDARLMLDIPVIKNIVHFSNIEELFPKFSEPGFHADFVTVDIETLHSNRGANAFELLKTLKTLINCTVRRNAVGQTIGRDTKIVCLVGEATDPALIKDTMRLVDHIGIKAGHDWGYEDVRDDVRAYTHSDMSMPKKVLDLLRPRRVRTVRVARRSDEIYLTPRQRQIFNLISTRGSSNKTIAKLLDISESTVKLHTSAILKKYGVKNRTQLAVFAKAKDKATE